MKIAAIADLHGHLPEPPADVDLILIAGDICPHFEGAIEEKQSRWLDGPFRSWLNDCEAPVVATWGNHDFVGQRPELVPADLNWHLLVDDLAMVHGISIWGTPWVRKLPGWAFDASDEMLEARAELIPGGVDVLMSHQPPFALCDWVTPNLRHRYGANVGDRFLNKVMDDRPPKLVICGHVHEARGSDGIVHNVAGIDVKYKLYPEPWTFLEV